MNQHPVIPIAVGMLLTLTGAAPPPSVHATTVPETAVAAAVSTPRGGSNAFKAGKSVVTLSIPVVRPARATVDHSARRAIHHRHRWAGNPVALANRAATAEPEAQGFLNAVQVYPFADGMLYHIYTAPGRVTDIALQPGEALGAVAAGDTVRWVIGDTSSGEGVDKRTHVLVKPFAAGLSTNLVVTTDKRTYHLALTSTAQTAMAAISWSYPADQLIALRKAAEQTPAAAPIAPRLDVAQLHFGYAISGDQPDWRPLRAFDDGRQTFIEFPASLAAGEAPPLFVTGPKGETQLVNYRVEGRFYIVDRLFGAAELRLGLKHQQVVRISRVADIQSKRRAS